MELSFKDIFRRFGKLFVKELQNDILGQKGIDGQAFQPSQGSVKGGKVVQDGGTHDRLNVTGKLNRNAFKKAVTDTSLTVYGNESNYGKGRSYGDILYYNNKPTSANKKSPLVFPTTDEEFLQTDTAQEFDAELKQTLDVYFKDLFGKDIRREIKIG